MLAHLKILNDVDRFCFAITSAQMTFLEFSAKETVKDGSHNKVLQTVAFSSTATISQTVTVTYYLLLFAASSTTTSKFKSTPVIISFNV